MKIGDIKNSFYLLILFFVFFVLVIFLGLLKSYYRYVRVELKILLVLVFMFEWGYLRINGCFFVFSIYRKR